MPPDTAYLAEPVLVHKVGTKVLPLGVERLNAFERGETLYVWIRFWEASPEGVRWTWGKDTMITVVKIPPLPPDSLMPLADFSIPPERPSAESVELEVPWSLVFIGLGLVLFGMGLYPLYRPWVYRLMRRLYLWVRWQAWLYRWRKPQPERFLEFIGAVKALLRPYASIHPGSLTLSELASLRSHPALQQMLTRLWQAEYQIAFEDSVPPKEVRVQLWRAAWKTFRRMRLSGSSPLIEPFLTHHKPSE
ncbi:MAG: hypothetical protein N3E49_02045 [Bacteroidia bacterium]|nr:hypothetical protein [Bacteroidia bacterium]